MVSPQSTSKPLLHNILLLPLSLSKEQLTAANTRLAGDLTQLEHLRLEVQQLRGKNSELSRQLAGKSESLTTLERDKEDFDVMLQLKLDKERRIAEDLRHSLTEAWADLAKVEVGGDPLKERVQVCLPLIITCHLILMIRDKINSIVIIPNWV